MKKSLLFLLLCAGPAAYARRADTALGRQLWIAPVQFTENGAGIGAGYERTLGGKGRFALYLPVMATFNLANTNRIYDYNTGSYSTGKPDAMYYAMPGIKWYPTGCGGKINYALGVSAVGGVGKHSSYEVNLNGLNTTELVQGQELAGVMVHNTVTARLQARIYIAADLGAGATLLREIGGNKAANEVLAEGGLTIAYRL